MGLRVRRGEIHVEGSRTPLKDKLSVSLSEAG